MNLKASLKYHLLDNRKAIIIFYIVILFVIGLAFTFAFSSTVTGDPSLVSIQIAGVDGATMIFLFILGLNSFKERFRMFIQNGISRKTMFVSFILSTAIISVGMALISCFLVILGKLSVLSNEQISFQGMFEQIYGYQTFFKQLFFLACVYMAVILIGYFITVLYYRMNKGGKIAVSVGVPAFLIAGLPIIDYSLAGGAINNTIAFAFTYSFGLYNGANPYYGMFTCLCTFTLFSGLVWLLMRKAVIKD